MPFKVAAAHLRHGVFCVLTSLALLSSPHASASTLTPVISGTPAASIVAGQYYAFTPAVSGPKGYPLSFSISGKPAWAGFNRLSGQLLGTPTAASVGKYSNIIITVSDGVASASLPPFSISVTSNTTAPTISGTPAASIAAGSYYAFTPKASGPKGYPLSFSISGKPAWVGFNRLSGQLLGTPTAASVGKYSNIVITVSDGVAKASLPPFSITVTASSGSTAPTISGTPSPSITVGQYYAFTPKASGPKGYPLSFSISGKPAWAGFNRLSGQLLGTPTAASVGQYSNIVISVSDGVASASLAPFSIVVSSAPPQLPSGSVTINWTPPTENTDGSTLTNLAGYHLYYGTSQTSLDHVINITNPGLASYAVSNLSAATWYFAVTSVNSNGTESPRSAVVSYVVQ